MLAVHQAGGFYVPLDPAYPAERLAFLLADAAPSVVLTVQALRIASPSLRPACLPWTPGKRRTGPRRACPERGPRRSRLPHLYLGIDGDAERRDEHAS